jgi:hypothetical protein
VNTPDGFKRCEGLNDCEFDSLCVSEGIFDGWKFRDAVKSWVDMNDFVVANAEREGLGAIDSVGDDVRGKV